MKTLYFNFLLISILLLFTACPPDLISGCMDSLACNYNPEATEDDGGCQVPLDNPIEITFIEENSNGEIEEDLISTPILALSWLLGNSWS